MNYCNLCGTELFGDKKVKSHLLTGSQYVRPLTQDNSEVIGLENGKYFDPSHNYTDNKILCRKCDLILGKYEEERGKLLKIGDGELEFNNSIKMFPGIDGKKVKLACLSDLFRCSSTNKQIYSGINLGSIHSDRIKRLLLNPDNISFDLYPTTIGKVNFGIPFAAASFPIKCRIHHRIYYRSIMPGGWLWLVKIDSVNEPLFDKFSVDMYNLSSQTIDYGDPRIKNIILSSIYRDIKIMESKKESR